MFIVESLFIFFLALIVKIFWMNKNYFYFIYKIPSINYKPIVKSFFDILNEDTRTFFKITYEMCKSVNSIAKVFCGFKCVIILTKPEYVNIVMNSKKCLEKSLIMRLANIDGGSLFGTIDAWNRHHKIIKPFFSANFVKNYVSIFNEKSLILAKNLAKKIDEKEFNIFYNVAALTLDSILSTMAFDVDLQNMKESKRDAPIKSLEK